MAAQSGRLKVVTLLATPRYGGGERLAIEITTRLDPERYDRVFAVSRWSDEGTPAEAALEARLERSGVRLVKLRRRSRLAVRAWRPLLQELRSADVLHSHMFGSNVSAAILSGLARVPVFVAHEHTWSFEGQPLRRFLDRELIARRSDAFVAVSRADRRRMIEIEGIDPDDVLFIPNGVPPTPPASEADKRTELGIPPDAFVVGSVGALRPQKAFDVLIRAAAILRRRLPELHVAIVGPGSAADREAVSSLSAELGLTDNVHLLGARSDVAQLLQAFDVAAVSSDFEGTPLSVLEYMEAALPVVATRVGGIPEMVTDGVEGLLVDPRDPEALAEALLRLARDPERRAEMGARGRERRRREFDIDTTVRAIEELYEQLLMRKRADGHGRADR